MMSAEDYRMRANECAEWARIATTEQVRAGWQELADAWTQLAKQGFILPHEPAPPAASQPH